MTDSDGEISEQLQGLCDLLLQVGLRPDGEELLSDIEAIVRIVARSPIPGAPDPE